MSNNDIEIIVAELKTDIKCIINALKEIKEANGVYF
jgi:hypothetical protein